jgi:glycine betaine/proline transport system ATP-binding protein
MKLGDRIAIMRDGAVVQMGTAEDLIGKPADNYVADFMRDISKSHVLTLRYLARPARPGEATDGPELDSSTIIRDASQIISQHMKPVRVSENGKALGIVSSEDILKLISGDAR